MAESEFCAGCHYGVFGGVVGVGEVTGGTLITIRMANGWIARTAMRRQAKPARLPHAGAAEYLCTRKRAACSAPASAYTPHAGRAGCEPAAEFGDDDGYAEVDNGGWRWTWR